MRNPFEGSLESTDEALTTQSAHVARLQARKNGPYMIAPDSCEPLPKGTWDGLDPDAVAESARRFPDVAPTGPLPDSNREFLLAGGEAAHRLLAELELV